MRVFRRYVLFLVVIAACAAPSFAELRLNANVGYFGETVTYPGALVGVELERRHSERLSTVAGIGTGLYVHPRSHTGVFVEATEGLRRHFPSGLFIEQHLGFGVLASFYNGDGVFYLEDDGTVIRTSPFGNWDIMPSVTFGIGLDLTRDRPVANLLWLRPRVFWQMPFNNIANFHIALQVGYSRTIREVGR